MCYNMQSKYSTVRYLNAVENSSYVHSKIQILLLIKSFFFLNFFNFYITSTNCLEFDL